MNNSTENLVDSLAIIKQLSFTLKNNIESDNYREVINTTTQLLQELRNGALSPKDYYEVWTAVCEQLIFVEGYVCDLFDNNCSAEEVYEEVQYTSAFIPRLYMMILVASCCVRKKLIPAKKLIYDILDMCKGIQHPMRGLFLRNYFIREMKDKLPYPGCRYETEDGGDVNDSVDCVLRNFVEMNRLWIRMQITKSRNKDQREKERKDLKVLVGTNFVVLSQLDGIDGEYYSTRILPAIVNEIISCNDPIAQEYLIESLIQVFPDDYHLAGLSHTLECICHLDRVVNVETLFNELLDRICNYSDTIEESVYSGILAAFTTFVNDCAGKDIHFAAHTLLTVTNCMLAFVLKHKKDCLKDMEELFKITHSFLSSIVIEMKDMSSVFVQLLSQPLEQFGLELLNMPSYMDLVKIMQAKESAGLAAQFAQHCFTQKIRFTDLATARQVFALFKYLVLNANAEDHALFSRCIHLLELIEEDLLTFIPEQIEVLQSCLSTPSHIPLMTLAYVLMRNCSSAVYYTHLSTVLELLRKVQPRQAMIATMDIASVADMRKEADVVKQFIEEAVIALDAMDVTTRMACHPIFLRGLTTLTTLTADEAKGCMERVEEKDKEQIKEVESRIVARMQTAVVYCTHTENEHFYAEEKATEIIEECKRAANASDLSTKEKNQAKAVLLRELIYLHTYCPAIITDQAMKDMFNEVTKSGKFSSATKKLLETLKTALAL